MVRHFRDAVIALWTGASLILTVAITYKNSPSAESFMADLRGASPSVYSSPSMRLVERRVVAATAARPADSPPQAAASSASGPTEPRETPKAVITGAAKQPIQYLNTSMSRSPTTSPHIQIGPLIVVDEVAAPARKPDAGAVDRNPVPTKADSNRPANERSPAHEKLVTHIYRPTSIAAHDLSTFIHPLLTPTLGTITSTPVGSIGEVAVVQDTPEIVERIDSLVSTLDSAPKRVILDTLIVDATLPESATIGLGAMRPNGDEISPMAAIKSNSGVIADSPSAFLNRLRNLGRASVVAASQLQVVGGQWTELNLSEHATGSLEIATKVRIRPSTLSDGRIRLELDPQLIRSRRRTDSAQPQIETLRFTTDLVVKHGSTAVIAGCLIDQPPSTERSLGTNSAASATPPRIDPKPAMLGETMLLVTPRIVDEK